MPSNHYDFPGLVADSHGVVVGSKVDSEDLNLLLDRVVVKSKTGCNGRTHRVSARLSGGVNFSFNGQMTDCNELGVALGGLLLPAFTEATISFEVSGYNPGETIDFEGTLYASLYGAQPSRLVRDLDELDAIASSAAAVMVNPVGMCMRVLRSAAARMPIVGQNGVFATARKDFLSMTTAISSLANEIRRNNDSRSP